MKCFLILVVFIALQTFSHKLVFVQNIFRHGARYPIFLNNDDFTNEPRIANNVGQLTTQGKNMHYLLGKALYKKYWKSLFQGTQTEYHYDHRQILVRSTNLNRTIQSAESQLRGWLQDLKPLRLTSNQLNYSLPPFQNLQSYVDTTYMNEEWNVFNQLPKYQSIPIHVGSGSQSISSSNPYDDGDFLLKFQSINCPKQSQWQRQNYNSQMGIYITTLPEVKEAIAKVQESFPSIEVNFTNLYKLLSNSICMEYLGEPVLKIFKNPKYQKIFKYIKQVSLYLQLFYQPIQYYTTATRLFQNTVQNIKSAIANQGPKLVLYSSHDTTVGQALATFNLTNLHCINDKYLKNIDNSQTCLSDYPAFATNLIMEVYKEDNGTYTFQVVFNNMRRKIPLCNWEYSCSIQQFYDWVDGWKVKNPNKQCGIQDEFKLQLSNYKKSRFRLYVAIAILLVVVIILSIWIWRLVQKLRTKNKKGEGYIQNFQERQHGNPMNVQLPSIHQVQS